MPARFFALIIAILSAFTAFTGFAQPARADDAANTAAQGSGNPAQRIFVLDAPFLEWRDISPERTPNLAGILESSALGDAVARSPLRNPESVITPEEAFAGMAAGQWTINPTGTVTQPLPLAGQEPGSGDNPAGVQLFSERVRFGGNWRFHGRLASALDDAAWTTIALGNSDLPGTAVRPAAVYASDKDGIVDIANTQPDDIIELAQAPYGMRTNVDACEAWLDAALECCTGPALVAIDSGDLYRAGSFRIDHPGSAADDAWEQALASFDRFVGMAQARMGQADALIVLAPLSGATNPLHNDGTYAPTIVHAPGYRGLLASDSTGRSNLITSIDLYATVLQLAQVTGESTEWSAVLVPAKGSESLSAATIATMLDNESGAADAINDGRDTMNLLLTILLGLSFGCSVIMLSPRIHLHARALAVFIPLTRALWVVASAYPLAANLVGAFLGAGSTPAQAIALCMGVTLLLAFLALLFARFTRWIYSIALLMLLTVVVLTIDQLTGGGLAQLGFLTYQPIAASRYYGIGNEGAGVLFAAWLMLSGLMLNRYPHLKISVAFRRWIFPLLTAAIIVIIIAPWWGANFGVLVWGIVGGGCAWWMFNGRRLTWKVVLVCIVSSMFLLLGLILADGFLSPPSHLGSMASDLLSQGIAYIPTIVGNIVSFGIDTLLYSPVLTVAFVLIWAYLAYLRIGKPGPYAVFWNRNYLFKASFTAAMIDAVIMLVIEDSGILLPALVLVYATAGLTWMICDLHRWELRALARSKGIIDDEVGQPVGGFKIDVD